jgi:LytS/YehU family sensor histidine kinase
MDYMLYESSDMQVYLKNDIDNIRNYIDIERIRQGNNAEISFDVKGEIGQQKIVSLTLLPLVENAFKHGVNTIIRGAYLRIIIVVDDENLEIDVRNNFKKIENEERGGIGLSNLENRLNLFYKNNYVMKVDALNDDYHVNLKLRLR